MTRTPARRGVLLQHGDELEIEREPDNHHDCHAVTARTLHGDNLIGRVARQHSRRCSTILREVARVGVCHRAYFLDLEEEIITRSNGLTYKSTRVNVRLEFYVRRRATDRQIRGVADAIG